MRRLSEASKNGVFGDRRAPLLLAVFIAVAATGGASEPASASQSRLRAGVEACEQGGRGRSIGLEELAGWKIIGPGKTALVDAEAGRVLEFGGRTPSPDAIVLLSPTRFAEDALFRFDVRFRVPRSLVVMIFSASTPQTGAALVIPEGPQKWWFWGHPKGARAQSYLFSIHTEFHQADALLRKRPGRSHLHATPDTVTEEGVWYSVEIGKVGREVWLDRDGQRFLEATDPEPLPGGHVGFLFTGDDDASVQIRNVSVLECPS